jgi:hypothetical protein
MYIGLHVKCPLLCQIWTNLFTHLRKILEYKTLWKSVQCEASCAVLTGMKLIVACLNFADEPEVTLKQTTKTHGRGRRFISTHSLTSALDVGGRLTPRPGHIIPVKGTRYPLYRRLDGCWARCGKSLLLRGFDPRTFQPTASRYTDRAIVAHSIKEYVLGNSAFLFNG